MTAPPHGFSSAYRYLFVAVLGLLVGAMATVVLGRAALARQDPLPRSLMQVMARQVEVLRAQPGRCAAAGSVPRLQLLHALAGDLEPAFPDLADDRRFAGQARALRDVLAQAQASPPQDCTTLAGTVRRIDAACQACHQDFR
ncbi:hypothetical protein HF319_06540 [Xanthomonas sp. Kuri4-1]